MTEKIKLYFDFDGTLCNSICAFTEVYNWLHSDREHRADWTKVRLWNMKDQCPRITDEIEKPEEAERKDVELINKIFGNERFFNVLEFYPEMRELIAEYALIHNNIYEVYIVSKGDERNLLLKREWIHKNLPFIKKENILLLDNKDMDKSEVDMTDGIIIDDNQECIMSSNARWAILFSWRDIRAEWNEDIYFKCLRAHNAESLKMNIANITKHIEKKYCPYN